jgi:hypothetical protein
MLCCVVLLIRKPQHQTENVLRVLNSSEKASHVRFSQRADIPLLGSTNPLACVVCCSAMWLVVGMGWCSGVVSAEGDWSSGMIPALGAGGREFDSRITPLFVVAQNDIVVEAFLEK